MRPVLVIDDEEAIRSSLCAVFGDEDIEAFPAPDAIAGLAMIAEKAASVVFLDVLLPRMGGLEALEKIKKTYPQVEVVMISGHANVDIAVKAVKNGAFDFLEKPLSIDRVLLAYRNALGTALLREENIFLKRRRTDEPRIIGSSPAIKKLNALIEQVAKTDARVLITGENGTGKELAARAVHKASPRQNAPFIAVNCAAIPDTLIESELFGHEKGAFTGAQSSRKGRFELADGGTLFLDEIADMSLAAQAKVLRVIQEQKLERVGAEKTIFVDVRIIAATNKNLKEECEAKRFREDLFFRLNVVPLHVPALRERKEDIIPILKYFLGQNINGEIIIDGEAEKMLTGKDWQGNIRELKNIAERIMVFLPPISGAVLDKTVLDPVFDLSPDEAPPSKESAHVLPFMDKNYNDAKAAFEKEYFSYHYAKNDKSLARTAEEVGMFPSNLHSKLKKIGAT